MSSRFRPILYRSEKLKERNQPSHRITYCRLKVEEWEIADALRTSGDKATREKLIELNGKVLEVRMGNAEYSIDTSEEYDVTHVESGYKFTIDGRYLWPLPNLNF